MRKLLLALALSACAHTPKGPMSAEPRSRQTEVDAAREEARLLLIAQSELAWKNWVFGDPLDLAHTYEGHDRLFSTPLIAEVSALQASAADPEKRRALSYFRVYLSGEVLGRATSPLSDQVATAEAEATFKGPDGVEHRYRELERLLAGERDHKARVALSDSALPVVEKLNGLLAQKEVVAQGLLASLGYASYRAYAEELRQVDLGALGAKADDLLTRTDLLYRTSMDQELERELGLHLTDARRADIARFNRSVDLDAYFPAEKMVARLRETLLGLGIDLDKQPNIRIDDAPLPNKNPRAVCFNVKVPSDVRLSVKPVGGVTDYGALFHEAGHAEHYANTATPVFEFQQLGDNAPTEAYAFLLEGLVANPVWLEEHAGLSGQRLADFARGVAVKKLYLLRRYAGKLLYELAWHAGAANPQQIYQTQLARAYGFPVSDGDAERYLVDHDDFFYAADYFRAWFLAAQIEAKLVERYGQRWWTSPEAGALLKSLWAHGNGLTVDEIARQLGDPGLAIEPLLRHFEQALGTVPGAG